MADTVITVRATLPYALRHPECTDVSPEKLMRMAADCIEGQEKLLHDRSQIMASNLKAQNGFLEKWPELERAAELLKEAVIMYENYALLAQPVAGFNAGQWVDAARATLAKVQKEA